MEEPRQPRRDYEPEPGLLVSPDTLPAHTQPEEAPGDMNVEPVDDGAKTPTPTTAHDSLVTVRLSEPPAPSPDTAVRDTTASTEPAPTTLYSPQPTKSAPQPSDEATGPDRTPTGPAQTTKLQSPTDRNDEQPSGAAPNHLPTWNMEVDTRAGRYRNSLQDGPGAMEDESSTTSAAATSPSEKGTADTDQDQEEVDWDELQKSEDRETKAERTDNNPAMLLARLEHDNPITANVRAADRAAKPPRPPSMAQLRDMVNGPTPPALRYSMVSAPPMTDLEFYTALVQDYRRTAAELPTLLSNKVRRGIPPPLRGVVWQSMSGARDAVLEERFERLNAETGPHESVLLKDLGKGFPVMEKFRGPEGEGRRMLGRVLKCYSLHDPKIGYCHGLAFMIGPLLMHMSDKAAFSVLVRLMESYDLRAFFLPDMPGLHLRIYQFRELLVQMLPGLSAHLDDLQVDAAYVSQWFLSFFAVTSPLPMLFRIYDVIFAEGVSESLMRVALCLMRKNQRRLLACTELEDGLQLLLSRAVWDCYHYNADEFVQDFVSLSDVVTRDRLDRLEREFRDSRSAATASANAARSSAVTTAANRFLGRISAGGVTSPKQATLSPTASAPSSRPFSMLRRTASKQSLASTLNSAETSSASIVSSSASTAATTVSRYSSSAVADESTVARVSDYRSVSGGVKAGDDRYLHSQIEDLLTALGELQRSQALLADELQREREEREEDRMAARRLLDGLQKKKKSRSLPGDDEDELSDLVESVEHRFGLAEGQVRPSTPQSKLRLRDELARTKDQLATAMSQSQDLGRKMIDLEQDSASLRDQLRESHLHVRSLHQDKQRLEKQVHNMRVRVSAASEVGAAAGGGTDDRQSSGTVGGLRELKLGRSRSSPSQAANSPFTKRMSSLVTTMGAVAAAAVPAVPAAPAAAPVAKPESVTMPATPAIASTAPTAPTAAAAPSAISWTTTTTTTTAKTTAPPAPSTPSTPPPTEHDGLLLELIQAKTAEAMARQEADEIRMKLESLKKAYGLAPGGGSDAASVSGLSASSSTSPATAAGAAASAAMGVIGRLTGSGPAGEGSSRPATASTTASSAAGSFWGWRR